jgi:peptidoglycan/LPS O-acetylase OafA/YrhL
MSHADPRPAAPTLDHETYRRQGYFPVLDGVRALCVLLVVTVHLYDLPWLWRWLAGARGVTVFFVLSGFLITTLALREERKRGRLSLAAFYVRRTCRIFPLYYLTLAAYTVLILTLPMGAGLRPILWRALPYYTFYFQEVPFYSWLVLGQQDLPFCHSWSLGVEEKFYLVWPLLAFVLWRGSPLLRRRGAAVLMAVLAAATPWLSLLGPTGKVWGRCLFCYYPVLAGCLLAALLDDPLWFARMRRLARHTGAVLALFLALHLATPWASDPLAAHAVDTAYPLAAAALLACLVLADGRMQRALRWGPLVGVGKLSYGVYLVHVLCMIAVYKVLPVGTGRLDVGLLAFVLTCGLSVAVAGALAWAVEKPCIELGRRWSRWLTERAAPVGEARRPYQPEARAREIAPLANRIPA